MSSRKTPTGASDLAQPEHLAALAQIRCLADASSDTLLLAESPPQPDYALLDLCAEGIHAQKQHGAVLERWRAEHLIHGQPQELVLRAQREQWERAATKAVRAASKIPATPCPGIYAKAMLARNTKFAAVLVNSLAEDFVNCKALRATLWPAGSADA